VLNLSTNDANKAILERSIDFPLSDYECFIDLCDKEELHDSAMIILMPQLVKENYSFVFDLNTYAENKNLLTYVHHTHLSEGPSYLAYLGTLLVNYSCCFFYKVRSL